MAARAHIGTQAVQAVRSGRRGRFVDDGRIGRCRKKPLFEFGCWHRTSEIIALAFVASHFDQDGGGLGILDAFGDHRETELLAKTDRGANDRSIVSLVAELSHERPVDFQDVHRKFLQVREARIPAKIVESNRTPNFKP